MKGQNAQTDIPSPGSQPPSPTHLAYSLPHLVRSLPHLVHSLPHLVRSLVRLVRSLLHRALWFPTLSQMSHKVVQISYLVHDAQHHPKQW